eukprot:COSAG06_NODE_54302_length_295_cov_0.862245_1_plen_77_part_01
MIYKWRKKTVFTHPDVEFAARAVHVALLPREILADVAEWPPRHLEHHRFHMRYECLSRSTHDRQVVVWQKQQQTRTH